MRYARGDSTLWFDVVDADTDFVTEDLAVTAELNSV